MGPAGSTFSITTRFLATRSSSRIPSARSLQWWSVKIAIAASTLSSVSGSASAAAWSAGTLPGGRWAIMTAAIRGSVAGLAA